jgi:multiple sugar transport system permease protein
MTTTSTPAGRLRSARRRSSPARRRETTAAFGFLSPWIVGFLIFTAGPIIYSLYLAFTDYDIINEPEFVGTANFQQMIEDPRVKRALWNTFIFAVMKVPLTMITALALAMLLLRVGRAVGFFRTAFYLPVMTPAVAVGILFLLLFNGDFGIVNRVLAVFGIDGPNWTTDGPWVKPGLALMSLWALGGTVIIYLAALNNVPQDLYEAAAIDGASPWKQFRHVTLPMISGALFFTFIIQTIAAFQTFDEAYTAFFGNRATAAFSSDAALFYVIYLFQQAFQFFHMGYASALAWLLFVIIMIITAVQVRLSNRFVYYEGETR